MGFSAKNVRNPVGLRTLEIRPVNRIEQRIGEAEKLGFKRFLLPKYNLQGIDTQKLKIELVPVRKVEEAFRALFG